MRSQLIAVAAAAAFLACGESSSDGSGGFTSTSASQCNAYESQFAPCGGNLQGEWVVKDFCASFEEELDEECSDGRFSLQMSTERGLILKFDGENFHSPATKFRVEISARFPLSCEPDVSSCEELSDGLDARCTGSQTCTCSARMEEETEAEVRPYSVDGNTFIVDYGIVDEANEYCVQGDTLYVRAGSEVEGHTLLIATRK